MKHLEWDDMNENEPLWAYAFKTDDRATNLFCKPTLGVIKDGCFYQFKRDRCTLRKTGVSEYARYYANLYDDAVRGFNDLVQNRIDKLKAEIRILEELKIITEEV